MSALEYNTEELSSLISITNVGLSTHITPRNSLNEKNIGEALQTIVLHCIDNGQLQLFIDMTAVTLVDSLAIEMLLDIQDRLIRLGGNLGLIQVSRLLQQVFLVTGLDQYIKIIKNNQTGESSFDTSTPVILHSRLGDCLLEKQLITEKQIEEAVKLQHKLGQRLGQIVIDRGWVTEADLLTTLGEQLQVPFIRLKTGLYDPVVAKQLDQESTQRLQVMPLFLVRGLLTLATFDPQAMPSINEIEDRLGCRVTPVLATREDIHNCMNETYEHHEIHEQFITDVDEDFEVVVSTTPEDFGAIDDMAAGSPVINLVNAIIQRAVRDGASDIHIEPSRNTSRVRYRIDGLLYEAMTPRPELHAAITSRLKVMANLDIAERRLPQDGRIQVQTQGRTVDLRFSSLPGLYGEKIVLRVLDKNQAILNVNKLGMDKLNLNSFKTLLDSSYGMVLVTGPTGSGKTTSLYAALNYLNSIEKNIVTIEDPVEYQLDVINQNEVRTSINLTFAKMLKHILRQDPDIVMVGEIRDSETANITVQAALTGHFVLSTLHTNDSPGAITRMIDMGVEPYMLSSALVGVIAQRLLRAICPHCKTSIIATPEVAKSYGWDPTDHIRLYHGRGCSECYDSGYKGRIGIYEILPINPTLQKLIMTNPSRDQLNEYLITHQITTLKLQGLTKVREGLTTLEEVSRVVNN